jgi:hypothetical protein
MPLWTIRVAKPTLTKVACVNKKKAATAAATKKEPAASEEPPEITRSAAPYTVCNRGFQATRHITQLLHRGRPFLTTKPDFSPKMLDFSPIFFLCFKI